VTEWKSELLYVVDGKTAWHAAGFSLPPGVLQLKEGQTIQQALSAAVRPNMNFFYAAHIPSHVAKPIGKKSYGSSQLTASGPQ
jgi:hypothetical protein